MGDIAAELWPTLHRHVWRIEAGDSGAATIQGEEIEMVLEEPLALHVNSVQAAVLMRLPGMEKELAAGFLLSEGLVDSFADVYTIHHCGQGLPAPTEAPTTEGSPATSRNRVEVRVRPDAWHADARLDIVRLVRAGCGAIDVAQEALNLPSLPAGPPISHENLLGLDRAMRQNQRLHQQAGGVHAAALFDAAGHLLVLCEDIGRHNALDKVIGHCLLRGIPLHDKVALSSGRLSYEMVAKALRLGIPVLASASAPTALAVQLADRLNLTVIGYLRGRRMTLYTHPERIVGP